MYQLKKSFKERQCFKQTSVWAPLVAAEGKKKKSVFQYSNRMASAEQFVGFEKQMQIIQSGNSAIFKKGAKF